MFKMAFIPSEMIYLTFIFEIQDYCLLRKQRKQSFTSQNSGSHTQQYHSMKNDEPETDKNSLLQMLPLDADEQVIFAAML